MEKSKTLSSQGIVEFMNACNVCSPENECYFVECMNYVLLLYDDADADE